MNNDRHNKGTDYIRRWIVTRMSEYDDMEEIEQQVQPWLKKMGIPTQNYRNLGDSDKILLHGRICKGNKLSDRQFRDLYQRICLPNSTIAGRKAINPVDFMPFEKLEKFFSPLTPSERLPYLYKF